LCSNVLICVSFSCSHRSWIECVGHADRSAYDLKVHTESSKVNLTANETLETPIIVKKFFATPNRPKLGARLGAKTQEVLAAVFQLSQEAIQVR